MRINSAERIKKECPICNTIYLANVKRVANGRDMFCSKKCSYVYRGRLKQKIDKIWTKEYISAYNKQYRKDNREKLNYLNRLWDRNNPGIFNVIYQKGYLAWTKNKLGTCQVVINATEQYKQANDILFDFFEEFIEIDEKDNQTNIVQARLLLQRINEWRPKNKPMTPRALRIYMKHKGFKHDKKRFNSDTNASSAFWGLKLINDQSVCHHTELIEQQELKIINDGPINTKLKDNETCPF